MSPNTNRPKTERRRFRGLEVAQAALLLVLGVVATMALYFVMMDIMRATPAPDVQLDPYNSYVNPRGNWGVVALKFGKTATVLGVWIDDSKGFPIARCDRYFPEGPGLPLTAYAGSEYTFSCYLVSDATWDNYMTVHVKLADGMVAHIPWVVR